jgi:hypothetical protein
MLNVVRHAEHLRLIDFDASVKISEKEDMSYVGLKFSSGSAPPEVGGRLCTKLWSFQTMIPTVPIFDWL